MLVTPTRGTKTTIANKPPLAPVRISRVFIVDDHPAAREGLAVRIEAEPDLRVCGEAPDLGEALKGIAGTEPDIVIIDIGLKRGDGLELVKRLKDRGCPSKMLVWSWRSEELYAERALRAGASGFVSKDEATSTIVEAIRKILAGGLYLSADMMSVVVRRNVAGLDREATPDSLEELSNRELEVFQLTGQGKDTVQVAEQLCVSAKTVETYKARIKVKLGLDTGGELLFRAMRWVIENG